MLKLAENQAKAKQYREAGLLLFENYSRSLSTLSFKNNRKYSRICIKKAKYIGLNEVIAD